MGQLLWNQGLNTAQDRSYLGPGELQLATGAWYRPGDTFRLWKILGRTTYGTAYAGASAGQGIALLAFDANDTDRLVVYNADGEFHSSVVTSTDATAGTFATLTTGFTTGPTVLSWAHFDDVWFLCNSKNRPIVLHSDGTTRKMGMLPPDSNPVVTASTGTYTGRLTTATFTGTEWVATAGIFDANLLSYGYSWLRETDPLDDKHTIVCSAAAADTSLGRFLIINWALQSQATLYGEEPGAGDSSSSEQEFQAQVLFRVSEDNGGSWTTISDSFSTQSLSRRNLQVSISADSDQIQVEASITQKQENPTQPVALLIFDIRLTNAGITPIFTTSDGMYYAISEYDAEHGLESPFVASNLVSFAAQNVAQMSLPTQVNAHATHFRIYRTHDGGQVPGDLRFQDTIPITETSWLDTFDKDKDFVGGDVAPVLKVQLTDTLFSFYASNTAPEAFRAIVEYQNFLVGISEQFPRQLSYSLPGEPEYWPLLYRITDFPLKEHDQLTALAVAGDLLIVSANEAIIVVNGLPELEAQSYASASMTVLRGAPGCVGPRAMTEYSLAGEPRVVWVAEQGIFQTNGNIVQELSGDLDWATSVSRGNLASSWIFYDKEDQILIVGVDTDDDGFPDREYWLHMAQEHQKQGGRPKITGPHYSSKTNQVAGLAPDGRYRVYSLDNDTTGGVYHEKDGGTDAGQFFNGASAISLDVKSPRVYGPNLQEWAVDFPTVRHTSWNSTPLTLTWKVGRDEIGEEEDVVNTLTLSSQGQTKFVVARSGEWHEVRLQHTGNAGTDASIGIIEHNAKASNMQGDTKDS